jgi:glycosyltransferase involved in cell wall biosynthesis
MKHGDRAAIYHYRSGFGGRSLRAARARGLVLLCDHTIAHPAVIEYLVEHAGALPPGPLPTVTDPVWRRVLEDITAADHIVVNSDWVAETFRNQGVPSDRVHVVYAGPDDAFLEVARRYPERRLRPGPCRLLFVGGEARRKGLDVLLRAIPQLDVVDWTLDLVGPIDPKFARRHAAVFADPRVSCHGTVPRLELAEHMHRADVFVFPSLAEGSARVVPMAMALGCYVVTTPNSGSIVVSGQHGALVPAGHVSELADAISAAAADPVAVAEVGERNRRLILERYRQEDFGDAFAALYGRLLR